MYEFLGGISFWWAAAGLAAFALFFAVKAFLGYRSLDREAQADWDYRAENHMQDLRLTKAGYVQAYKRVYAPRASLYILAGLLAIMILMPIIFMLLDGFLLWLYQASGQSRTFEPGYLVWQFYIFFGMIAGCAAIAAVTARQFYKRAPASMQDALQAQREAYVPPAPFIASPSPAHIEMQPDEAGRFQTLFGDILELSTGKDVSYPHSAKVFESGGSQIITHTPDDDAGFDFDTQNLLAVKKHKREAPEPVRYDLIFKRPDPVQIINRLRADGIQIENVGKYPHERLRSFTFKNLNIYIYKDEA